MFQIRIHGRGGQGVVTAAELLSVAAFLEGKQAQAFPSFGAERTGAPLTAFCRVDDRPIRLREPVMFPDALIIQDATLLRQSSVFDGLAKDGWVLVNAPVKVEELGINALDSLPASTHCRAVNASALALKHVGKNVPNAALLGAFAALTGRIRLESVLAAIRQKFPGAAGEANAAAAEEAARRVLEGEVTHAVAN